MRVLVNVLAGYRILRLMQVDDIFTRPRTWVWVNMTKRKRLKYWAVLVDCPWCLGVWVAAGVVFANAYMGKPWEILANILAYSAVIGFLGWLDQKHIR